MFGNGFKPVSGYVSEITEIIDALATAGDKTSDSDVVLYALEGYVLIAASYAFRLGTEGGT